MKFIEGAKYAGANRVELYTEPYANMYNKNSQAIIMPFVEASFYAKELGLGLNAGHDLNLNNLNFLLKRFLT